MEKLYFKYSGKIFLMFLFLLLFFVRGASAQTTLAQGDVSVIGFNASSSDNFAFVPWVDLAVNTEIRFTDNAFNSTAASGAGGNYRAQEAEIIWKNNTGATIQAGTIITVFNDAANINTATNIGQIVSVSVTTNGNATSLNLTNTSGDQIFIYQGSSNVLPGTVSSTFTGTIIFGLGFSGSGVASTTWLSTGASTGSTSYLPGDLLAANQVFLGPNAWGGEYTGARNGLSSLAAYKALVTNPANWNKITTGVISPFNLTSFSSGPIISGQPANRTICVNSTTTFNVTSDATSYQWQVSTDGGNNFSNITNTAPYSGVTTNTLTITAAPATLSGFRYRVVATNASGSVNSNSGTLAISNMVSSVTSQTNIACFGSLTGAATVGVSGGVAPYTYSWSPSGGTASSATGLGAGTYTVTITDNIGCTKTQTVNIAQPATGITTTGSQTNVSCNGGSNGTATVTATGGTGTYTYSWSPSGGTAATASGLVGGAAYTVTVTDANGCTATRTFNIMQPAVLAATTLQTNVSCNGGANGTATAVPSGGAGGYTYAWLPSGATTATASGLGVGNHTVTITDANACTTTRTVTITQPSLLNTSPARTNVACNGGSNGVAAISASGGTFPYTYLWSNGATTSAITGLTAGDYTVTVTDGNSCTSTKTITITQPSLLTATTSQTNVSCKGGTNGTAAVAPAGGAGGYTYAWLPSGATTATATGLGVGNHTVTITDANSCTITKTVTLTEPATAITSTGSQTNVSCNGGSNGTATVTATGGTGTYTYSWSPSGGTAATASGLLAGAYTVTITDANGCTATRTFNITQPAALAATTSQTNLFCNGVTTGNASVSVTGGTGAYSYSWSPSGGTASSAIGLGAGTYTVTITDANNCILTKTITITQPAALVVTPSHTNVSCNGGSNGSATAVVTGGTGAYTYSWSPSGGTGASATGLTAGTYTVTIKDANLCQTTQSYTITEPAVLAATPSQTNVSCNGGSNGTATVAVTGGTGAYSYAWSPTGGTGASATGLTAGTYIVTIKDANLCQTTQSFTITGPAAITSTGSQTNVSCNGGSNGTATVTATGGTGAYTYSWAPSGGTAATASGLLAGAYTVTITDANGCTATRTFNITQPAALAATTSQTNLFCNGVTTGNASVSVTGGTGAYSYSWSPSGGTASSATGLGAGTYTVTIKDANNCILTKTITITQPTALAITPSHTNVSCNGGSNGSATAVVTGGTGAYTYSWSPSGGTAATASGLTAGTYTVTIKDANLCQTTQSYTITEPAILAATPSQTNVSCNGGSNGTATVTVTGGTGAYSYAWSPTGGTGASATGLTAGTYIVTIKDANLCQTTQSFTITGPAAITSTGSQTNVSCNGGSNGTATVTATGGTGAYTYSWAPSGGTAATASGLLAGAYTVTITDANGCTATRNFNITQPTALAATTSQTNLLCYGGANGTASVSVTGGTGAYSYSWSPSGGTASSATGLGAGTYTVTIKDANNCILTKTITITQPVALAITPSHTNVSCNGGSNGSATAVVTGGTGAYTYSWSPSGGTAATASGLTAGTYTVIIKDANLCQITQSYTITEPAVLAVTPSQTNVLCNGSLTGTATVAVTGGTGAYSYAWLPTGGTGASATGLGAGTYIVTIKDANLCQTTQSFTITQPVVLTATAAQSNVLCNGGTNGSAAVTAAGGTGPYTYSWAPSGGTAAVATGLAAGTYTVTIKDANLCSITKSFTITQPSALAVTPSQTNVACNGSATGSASVSVTGGTGAYSYVWAPSGGTAATASGLIAGTYTVTIKDANLCQTTQSFTISQPTPIALTATTLPQAQVANVYNANLSATGGVGTYTYSVTSGTLPNGLSLSPAGVISGTPTISGTFNFDVKVTDSGCGQSSTLSFSITAITSDQTITFTAIPTQTFGNTPVTLAATSTSGLTVSFASDNAAVATVAGNVLTINGAGTANITASQAGGAGYNPAPDIVKVLTVNKATASIALSNLSYIYDGTAKVATVVTTPAGLSGVSVTYNGSATLPKAAGTYAVVASLNNTNYTAPNATGSLVIAPKAITVSADAKSKTYGSADPALTYSVPAGSLVGTDAITGSLNRAPGESVGTYAIGQNTLTAGNNYTITYAPANLTIGTKSITVTADAKSKTYGSADPALTYSVPAGSLVGTDAITGSLNRAPGENVGTYAIGQNTLTAGNNYTITYVPANLTIGTKAITVTADAKSKTYGSADPALTYSVPAGSLVGTDAITGSLNRAPGENVGTYAIGQNTLTAGNNYTITYNTANLTINPKALTITADGKTRVFGVANPVLTVSYSGFITGESSTVLTSPAVISTTATITSPSGTYPITASGAAAANYSISYVPGSLVITATSQSITFAALASKLSTDAPFTLTATATSGLAVSYSSSDVSVARIINGNQVEILKAGVVTITASQAGNGNYTAAAAVNQSLTVLDNPAPIISIVSSKGNSISKGITTVLTASGALTYSWSNASGIISGQNTASLTVRPAQTTTYTVTGANQYGRTSTQSITIEVLADYKALNITNALSPNGDGVNDFWIVENIDMYPNNTVKIVDRSGRSVYEKKGYDNSWDGNFRGAQLAEGTYYYIIDFGPGIGFRKGFITIVR